MIEQYLESTGLTQAEFAGKVGVHPSMVWQWIKNERPISALSARNIETATEGEITRYQLRPDIFGADPAKARKTERNGK